MQALAEHTENGISRYQEILKSNPCSYCFAPLAELLLQAGRTDEALELARKGVARSPLYVSGQMALARICNSAGLQQECQQALEAVTIAMPEHDEAQQLLAGIYKENGQPEQARVALETLLELVPDTQLTRIQLDALDEEDDLELIELADDDILDLLEEYTEEDEEPVDGQSVDDPWSGAIFDFQEAGVETDLESVSAPEIKPDELEPPQELELPQDLSAPLNAFATSQDPLDTTTLAELYLSQGFPEKAMEIYSNLAAKDPANQEVAAKLAELEKSLAVETSPVVEEPAVDAARQAKLAALEGWLSNIQRLRECN